MSDETDVRQAVADELRRVADDIESGDLRLSEPIRYTLQGTHHRDLPADVEVHYYVEGVGERTIEVYV